MTNRTAKNLSLTALLLIGASWMPAAAQDAAPATAGATESVPGPAPAATPDAAGTAPATAAPTTDAAPAEPALPQAGPAPAGAGETANPVSTEAIPPQRASWSFEGPFGTYDRAALQRGFQVYKEVCSACHSLSLVAIRTLGEPGGPQFSEAEVRAVAAGYKVAAGPNEQGQTVDANGQPLTRAAAPSDTFPPPFANERAARAANNGALPPDLSLIVKARAGGANYVYSILTGFGHQPPAGFKLTPGMNYNPYFPGQQIAMPQPLTMGSVTFSDGTPNTIAQEAHDVTTFLAWAAEPKLEERKRTGFRVMAFLLLFTGLLYFSYRRVWHGAH